MKKLLVIFLAAAAALSLTACSGRSQTEGVSRAGTGVSSVLSEADPISESELISNQGSAFSAEPETEVSESEPDATVPSSSSQETSLATDSKTKPSSTGAAESIDGVRPEFKEAMDSYESFYNDYCEFLENYEENATDLTWINQYTELLSKAAEMDEKFAAWDETEMSKEELKYYLEVSNRITQRLIDVTP